MLPSICLDTETFYSKDYSVVDLGYYKYTRDPRFECYMLSVSDGSESWCGHPKDFNFDSLTGRHLLSHNKAFDEEVALAEAERGNWPVIRHAGWDCTSNMSAYLWAVRSLSEACRMGLGIEVSKDVRDRAKGKHWSDMIAEGWAGEMTQYGGLDATRSQALFVQHGHKWPEFERRLSNLTIEQGRRGVAIDVEGVENGILLMNLVIEESTRNLPWIARGKKPASPIGLYEECRSVGIPCPPVKYHDPEAAQEWEDKWAPHFGFVMALRNLRKAKKTLASLETIKLRLRDDGTMAFSLRYAGAHTLRWAGDSGFNMQNMAKEPLFVDPRGSFVFDKKELKGLVKAFKKGDEMPTGIKYFDMRGIITARPGKMLAPVDLAQIEPRVLNYLAGNFELLEKIRGGMAIYEAYARDKEGYVGPDIKSNDLQHYSLLKVKVLGLGYGAAWEKAIIIATMYDTDLTEGDREYALKAAVDGRIWKRCKIPLVKEWVYEDGPEGASITLHREDRDGPMKDPQECVFVQKETRKGPKIVAYSVYGMRARTVVDTFRRDNPLIVQLWATMQGHLEAAIGGDLIVEGPHGGCLTYRNVREEYRKATDEETGTEYKKKVITVEVGGKRVVTWGSKLTENLVQWVSRMKFAEGVLDMEDAGFPSLFSVHDENVVEVDPSEDVHRLERIMSATPSWLPGCPIGAEGCLTFRYKK